MNEPPAEILRRLRPIPTYTDPPTTTPHDIVGRAPDGTPCRIAVVEAAAPVLLLFLSAACLGCRDLWEGITELHAGLAGAARLVVVTRSLGEESPEAITALAGDAPDTPGLELVMSSEAYRDYRVGGPPFLTVVAADGVRTESVAWGLEQTLQTALGALPAR
ncbi:MAG TPA: hypothetical protein VIJ56_11060 [Acidimicrobiales bacterium]